MDRNDRCVHGLDNWDEQMDAQFLRAGTTWTEKHKQESLEDKHKVTVKDSVLEQYNEFLYVFSEEKSYQLPERRPYDQAIDLVPDAKMTHSKTYHLSYDKETELNTFFDVNLAKGYI